MKTLLLRCLLISLANIPVLAADSTIEVIPLEYRSASEIQTLLGPMLESTDWVNADGNRLLIRTSPERLTQIKTLVNQLDTPQRNLVITVLQSSHADAEELNAAAGAQFEITGGQRSKFRGAIAGHVYQTEGGSSDESTQTIRTLEGSTAYIKVGNNYPVTHLQLYNSGYGVPSVSTQTEFVSATTGFAVTPRLAGQQAILEITPWSENMNARGQIETQEAQATLKVNLGEWVELGGVDENSRRINARSAHVWQTNDNSLHILIKVDTVD